MFASCISAGLRIADDAGPSGLWEGLGLPSVQHLKSIDTAVTRCHVSAGWCLRFMHSQAVQVGQGRLPSTETAAAPACQTQASN